MKRCPSMYYRFRGVHNTYLCTREVGHIGRHACEPYNVRWTTREQLEKR